MTLRIEGRVAIVTGGASGIGRATAKALAEDGAQVVITDLDEKGGYETVAAIGASARFKRHDVASWDAWERVVAETVQELGRLDILVNCAGILTTAPFEEMSLAMWRKTIAVNVDGVFYGCKAAVGAMRANPDGGSIINLSSTSAYRADPDLAAYDASKGAVRSLTKEVAVYCARKGYRIRCNSVHPGTVETPMLDRFFSDPEVHRTRYESWMNNLPLGRPGRPDDIARLICFLASDDSSFMTGSECVVDGGVTAG